jgi:hypothetical protein
LQVKTLLGGLFLVRLKIRYQEKRYRRKRYRKTVSMYSSW